MKVIIDTNIVVNVLLSPSRSSASFQLLEMCLSGQLEPQLGNALLNEYLDVCFRPGLLAKSRYTKGEIEEILNAFVSVCEWNKPQFLWRPNLKDEGDNHLIELALCSGTRYVITNNLSDLLGGELRFDVHPVLPGQFIQEVYHG